MGGGEGYSNIKVTGMLLLKLMGVNCSFGSLYAYRSRVGWYKKKNIITFRHTEKLF